MSTTASRRPKQRRSVKVCKECHERKKKCDVFETGTPCSNCTLWRTTCSIRDRKNKRASSSTLEYEHESIATAPRDPSEIDTASAPANDFGLPPNAQTGLNNSDGTFAPDTTDHNWLSQPSSAVDGSNGPWNDYNYLMGLDEIFSFPGNAVPEEPAAGQQHSFLSSSSAQSVNVINRKCSTISSKLTDEDWELLYSRGCFQFPPIAQFKEIMLTYFKMIHPNLPLLLEDRFWSLWQGEHEFRFEDFSILVLRAMIFSVSTYLDTHLLASMGFTSMRAARRASYAQSKLLFDFDVESDPLSRAQACLLLTYHSPSYNSLRVNSLWLSNAIHYAKVVQAESYEKFDGPKSTALKRLWWCAIFRDRILSLGLRRSLQIELNEEWADGDHILRASDFVAEIGCSPVHDAETQVRLFEMISTTCRLMLCLSEPLRQLYGAERLDERVENALPLDSTIRLVETSLVNLRAWKDEAEVLFPFPISLDDTPDAICLYANMLFVYHASANFALHTYLLTILEFFPNAAPLIRPMDCSRALEFANHEVAMRIQELVQTRLINYLPISATPLIAPPLIGQTIKVAASRGSRQEPIDIRKLDVFSRALKSQEQRFYGSDFCIDVLNNIVAYVKPTPIVDSRQRITSQQAGSSSSHQSPSTTRMTMSFSDMIQQHPRLFLRLMLHLDFALCSGKAPQEEDFPARLRRDAMQHLLSPAM